MLKMDVKVAAWLTDPHLPWSNGAKRRAGRAGAEAARRYLQEHAPVRTGLMKSSWKPTRNAQGFTVRKDGFTIHVKNDAYELRRRGKHYYAQYPEYGFYHIGQRKYHPGRNDRFFAAVAAKRAIVEQLKEELPDEIRRMKQKAGGIR